ncbi:MAG TPA: hypothetical protein VEX38_02980 [Fimbriimonadaceae bacterium]|nr:hypothetical protein [Fimbriimonadaceae bacterium]
MPRRRADGPQGGDPPGTRGRGRDGWRWFRAQRRAVRLTLSLLTFLFGLFIAGNGLGLMMGDPLTPEASEKQRAWAPLAFFAGCPTGVALMVLGLFMVARSLRRTEPAA